MDKGKPTFLIVGAPRSGTTSLYEWLREHPDVFMPERKEPSYFVNGHGVENLDSYFSLFKDSAGKKAIGEASTHYLYCEESAAWIKSVLGNIKIIMILRNPVQRAFSLYVWMVQEGYEDAKTFEDALAREPSRLASSEFRENSPQFFPDYLYYNSGLYFESVSRFYSLFGRSNVKVYLFDDLVSDPRALCRDVFAFLGVDSNYVPNLRIHNRGLKPLSIPLQYWLRTRARYSHVLRFLPPARRQRFQAMLMQLNLSMGTRPTMKAETLQMLRERYRPNIADLMQLLDRDLSPWIEEES